MNIKIAILFCFIGHLSSAQVNTRHNYVRPHYRSNGTYVEGYYRTAPNTTNRDNFSTLYNTNPYTGKAGTVLPDNNYLNPRYPADITIPNFSQNLNLLNSTTIPTGSISDYTNDLELKKYYEGSLYESYPTYQTKSQVNIREFSSTTSAIISVIPKGELIKVTDSFLGNWWKVYYNGHTGYVASSLLGFVHAGKSENKYSSLYGNDMMQDKYFESSLYDSYPTYQAKSLINLREQMLTSSAIVSAIPKGSMVKVINSFFGAWWKVYYAGYTGYVASSLLNFVDSGKPNMSYFP